MSSIVLHKTLGVNARVIYCPKCGADSNGLVMMGAANYVDRCPNCEAKLYGGPDRMHDGDRRGNCKCGRCGHRDNASEFARERRELDALERVPGPLCDDCGKFYTVLHKAAKENNGVGVACTKCGSRLVLHGSNPFAKKMRDKNAVGPGEPFIIGVPKCFNCEEKEEADAVGETPPDAKASEATGGKETPAG